MAVLLYKGVYGKCLISKVAKKKKKNVEEGQGWGQKEFSRSWIRYLY